MTLSVGDVTDLKTQNAIFGPIILEVAPIIESCGGDNETPPTIPAPLEVAAKCQTPYFLNTESCFREEMGLKGPL